MSKQSSKKEEKAVSSGTLLQEDMLEADTTSLAQQSGRSEEADKPLGLRDAAAATRAQQLVASSWFSALPLSSSLQDSSLQEDMWEEEDRLRAAATRAQQLVASELPLSSPDSGMSA